MRRCIVLAGFLASFAFAPAVRAQDEEEPDVSEAACRLPDGGQGKLVTTLYPATCGQAGCSRESQVTLEDADERRLFTFDEQVDESEEPTKLTCNRSHVSLTWNGAELQFGLKRGRLELAASSAAALERLWTAPAASTSVDRTAHASLRALVYLVMRGDADGSVEGLPGVTQETADLVTLAGARDALSLGEYESAEATLRSFSFRKDVKKRAAPLPREERLRASIYAETEGPLSPTVKRRLDELERKLAAERRRSVPVTLGPRRFVGGAQRLLHPPFQIGEAPTYFFRGRELCVVDVEARTRQPRSSAPRAPASMHCVNPDAFEVRAGEPLALPPSSGDQLLVRDFTSWSNPCEFGVVVWRTTPEGPHPCQGGPGVEAGRVMGVVDGDGILATSGNGFALIRDPGKAEPLTDGEVAAVALRSAGTRLLAKQKSYFVANAKVMRVGGGEKQTWSILGSPPNGAYWVGVPLVSPDGRWVVAQSGNGDAPVAIWAFPVR